MQTFPHEKILPDDKTAANTIHGLLFLHFQILRRNIGVPFIFLSVEKSWLLERKTLKLKEE